MGTEQNISSQPLSNRSGTNLISSPLHARKEQNHSRDTQQASKVINLPEDFACGLSGGVDARRRVVEEQSQEEANAVPHADDDADVTPVGVI